MTVRKRNANLVNIKIQKPKVKLTIPNKAKFRLVIELNIIIIIYTET
jgi:hypothetical protein